MKKPRFIKLTLIVLALLTLVPFFVVAADDWEELYPLEDTDYLGILDSNPQLAELYISIYPRPSTPAQPDPDLIQQMIDWEMDVSDIALDRFDLSNLHSMGNFSNVRFNNVSINNLFLHNITTDNLFINNLHFDAFTIGETFLNNVVVGNAEIDNIAWANSSLGSINGTLETSGSVHPHQQETTNDFVNQIVTAAKESGFDFKSASSNPTRADNLQAAAAMNRLVEGNGGAAGGFASTVQPKTISPAEARSISGGDSILSSSLQNAINSRIERENMAKTDLPIFELMSDTQVQLAAIKGIRQQLDLQSPANAQGRTAKSTGLVATHYAQAAVTSRRTAEAEFYKNVALEMLDIATGVIPVVGWGKSVYEAVSGQSLYTGRTLDDLERFTSMLGALTLGISNEVTWIARLAAAGGKALSSGVIGRLNDSAQLPRTRVSNFHMRPKVIQTPEHLAHVQTQTRQLQTLENQLVKAPVELERMTATQMQTYSFNVSKQAQATLEKAGYRTQIVRIGNVNRVEILSAPNGFGQILERLGAREGKDYAKVDYDPIGLKMEDPNAAGFYDYDTNRMSVDASGILKLERGDLVDFKHENRHGRTLYELRTTGDSKYQGFVQLDGNRNRDNVLTRSYGEGFSVDESYAYKKQAQEERGRWIAAVNKVKTEGTDALANPETRFYYANGPAIATETATRAREFSRALSENAQEALRGLDARLPATRMTGQASGLPYQHYSFNNSRGNPVVEITYANDVDGKFVGIVNTMNYHRSGAEAGSQSFTFQMPPGVGDAKTYNPGPDHLHMRNFLNRMVTIQNANRSEMTTLINSLRLSN